LDEHLYFDTCLSCDKINYATCYILQEAGDDNLPTSIRYYGRINPKYLNLPTVLNVAPVKVLIADVVVFLKVREGKLYCFLDSYSSVNHLFYNG